MSEDVCYFPPPAGGEAGPDGDPKLVRLREVCLYQRDLLALRDQGLLHVSLLYGRDVVHLQLHQFISHLHRVVSCNLPISLSGLTFSDGLSELIWL